MQPLRDIVRHLSGFLPEGAGAPSVAGSGRDVSRARSPGHPYTRRCNSVVSRSGPLAPDYHLFYKLPVRIRPQRWPELADIWAYEKWGLVWLLSPKGRVL